jgi:hypothetical protein
LSKSTVRERQKPKHLGSGVVAVDRIPITNLQVARMTIKHSQTGAENPASTRATRGAEFEGASEAIERNG